MASSAKPTPQAANAILFNSPALHALKRDQLVKLCKMYTIKANGKNTSLIDRLKAHAQSLERDDPLNFAARTESLVSDSEENLNDYPRENPGNHASHRPSEQWEVLMDNIIEEDESSTVPGSFSTKSSNATAKSKLSHAGEFGTSRSHSSHGGSIKSLASSLGIRSFNQSSTARKTKDLRLDESRPYSEIPEVSPDKRPQTDHYTVDPTSLFDPATLTLDTEPIPGHSLRSGNPVPQNARLSLGLGPVTPSKPPKPSTTLRLVASNGETSRQVIPTPATPHLKPFPTKFDLITNTPPRTHNNFSFPSNARGIEAPLSPGLPTDNNALPSTSKPFIFGSPLHQRTNSQFQEAAKNVLEEMNSRLQLQGVAKIDEQLIEGLHTTTTPSQDLFKLPTPNAPVQGKIAEKFDRVHERQFAKMDSIATVVSSQNKKRTSEVLDKDHHQGSNLVRKPSEVMPGHIAKRPRVSIAPAPQDDDPEAVKRRAVVKKKLDQSKARRRSSAGGKGRISTGKVANRKPPGQASRFGFLSTAKTMVSNVWNRNKSNAVKPTVQSSISQQQSNRTESVEPPIKARLASTEPLPPSNDHSMGKLPTKIQPPSTRSALSAVASSLGYKTAQPGSLHTNASHKSTIPTRSSRSSRLLAPTASSLAKTQPRRVSTSIPGNPDTSMSHRSTNTSSETSHHHENGMLPPPLGSKLSTGQKGLQRSISGRRPRISRGKVIAKLASQRATERRGSGVRPTSKVRSSLGMKQRQSIAGKARPSGGPQGLGAKKRARQSEFVRPQRRRPTDLQQHPVA